MPSLIYNLVVDIPESPSRYYQLGATVISLGRGDQNAIILDEETVSSTHCEIRRKGDGYTVVDLSSTNGTKVNGESLKETSRELRDGDILTIGISVKARFVRVFQVVEKVNSPASQPGSTTQRLASAPSRPAMNPVAAAVARAAEEEMKR